jgi:hypothetical protein
MEQAAECLSGVARALMAGGEGDANLHLALVVQSRVQAAIAHYALGYLLDDGHLKPSPRYSRLSVVLVVDEACCIVRAERIPSLIPCHLRQRTIAAK